LEPDEKLYSLFNLICNKFTCNNIFVGDFNFSHIDWALLPGMPSGSSCNICNKFVDILQKKILNTACSVSN